MLKAYFWKPDKDAEYGLAVVAENALKAKHLAFSYWGSDVGHDEPDAWIQQRLSLIKDANVEGLKEPQVVNDLKDGLKRGMYAWVEEDTDCDICGETMSMVNEYDVVGDKIICEDCREKQKVGNPIIIKPTNAV